MKGYEQKLSGSERYEDIINLPHHVSDTRKRMTMEARAAQFSPFAALTGYDEEIDEAARLTDEQTDLSSNDEKIDSLDRTIDYLQKHASENLSISVRYFVPDKRKNGGEYAVIRGVFKYIDISERTIVLRDGRKIAIKDISDVRVESDFR